MKRFGVKLILVVGLAFLIGLTGSAFGAQRTTPGVDRTDTFAYNLAKLQRSLQPAQIDGLVEASVAWRALSGAPEAALLERIDKDVRSILSPAQYAIFVDLAYPTSDIAGGGSYYANMCLISSRLSLIFSIVGVLGCPGDTSKEATGDAYLAFSYAIICNMESASSCPGAVEAAADAYISWSQLMGTCDLADSAAATMGATYVFCGGVY